MSTQYHLSFALGSGGARGLAHAGVLAALEEGGIRPDLVVGTSMGAIVGALYAQDPDPLKVWPRLKAYVGTEEFASYWAPFVPRDDAEGRDPQKRLVDIFDYMQRKMIAMKTVTTSSQQDASKLRHPLASLFGPVSFSDLQINFAAVALDLVSGNKVTFTEGPLVDGLYASSAIPSVFPPVKKDGQLLCDGGGPFRVPVEACHELGADIVVAIDIPAFEETQFSTGLDMIMRSNTVARQRLNRYVCATADFVIRPEVTEYHWADFGAGEACHERGYEAGQKALPQLKALLRERAGFKYRSKKVAKKFLRL
ncbi:MAG: NTE family protein [Candidatus Krumholzibacteriia bacterium]|jgi:NTE family protein